jgi:multidrug efflux pump subunit AcrA (membrane-fusion protein)
MIKLMAWLCAGLVVAVPALAQEYLVVKPASQAVTLTGYTRARAIQTVAAETSGRVLQVNYDIGQLVGQLPFVEIDPTFIDFQIEQTRWSLERLEVARLRHDSQVTFLQKEFERMDTLHQDQVAPLARWEAVAEELTQARLALQATEAEISALRAQNEELVERRRRHAVVAPQGWVVIMRQVEPGEIIAAGTALARVADFQQMVVPLFVSGPELDEIRARKTLPVTIGNRPGSVRLNWINPEFDERTRKTAIELLLADFQGQARGGLLVELTLNLATGGLMVPRAAVTDRYGNPYVKVAPEGQIVSIFVLGENGENLIIADHADLEPGMALLSRPNLP